jgi:hypothetical protein
MNDGIGAVTKFRFKYVVVPKRLISLSILPGVTETTLTGVLGAGAVSCTVSFLPHPESITKDANAVILYILFIVISFYQFQ